MIAHGHLPEKLVMLLQNPCILKVGQMVKSDLKLLEDAVSVRAPFVGAVDLAAYAKVRHVVSSANCSLGQLCAVVLQKRLNKNVSERLSTAWEQPNLTAEQTTYAACDAYVPLLIYRELSPLSVPEPLPSNPLPSNPVLIFSNDNTLVIARGRLPKEPFPLHYDGIKISSSRVVVEVTEVLVPGAILSTHRKQALQTFGEPVFSVVCLRNHVKGYNPHTFASSFSDNPLETPYPPAQDVASAAANGTPGDIEHGDDEEPYNDVGVGLDALVDDSGLGSLLRESLGINTPSDGGAEVAVAGSQNSSRVVDPQAKPMDVRCLQVQQQRTGTKP
jgi:hypothetical protein